MATEPGALPLFYWQKFDSSRSVENPLYMIQNVSDTFQTYVDSVSVRPQSVGRGILLRIIRSYDESGTRENLVSSIKTKTHLNLLMGMRRTFGRSVDETTLLKPISMSTTTYYTFPLYFYGLAVAAIFLIVETLQSVIKRVIKLCFTYIYVYI